MIAGVEPNKKMSPIVTELFLRGIKFNIWILYDSFISRYIKLRLSGTLYFMMKRLNKIISSKRLESFFWHWV